MTPILVYGHPLGSSLGLICAFEWLGKPYRVARVDMLSEMKTQGFARLNARQQTPCLITPTGQVLTETMAIAAWLHAQDTQRVISFEAGSPEHLFAVQVAAFINTSYFATYVPLWMALEANGADEAQLNLLRKIGHDGVHLRHDQLEAMVGDTRYRSGERPGIADALFIGIARWLDFFELGPRTRWPKLDRIRTRLEQLPAFEFAQTLEHSGVGETAALVGKVPLAEVIAQFGA